MIFLLGTALMKRHSKIAANEYMHEDSRLDSRFQPLLCMFAAFGFAHRTLAGLLAFFKLRLRPSEANRGSSEEHQLHGTIDKRAGSLDLVLENRSNIDIWAIEAEVILVKVESYGEVYRPAPVTLNISELVEPTEILRVSLINTVYNAAGRPQGVYSTTLALKLRYRTCEFNDEQPLERSLPRYRTTMTGLVPIRLGRIGQLNRGFEESRPNTSTSMAAKEGEQRNRVRRSKRAAARSTVVVEGKFSDGNRFSDTTEALVLSAHGCLVKLGKPVDIGDNIVIRNAITQKEQTCQVVYVGKGRAGDIQVGLGFEIEAPDFWGVDCLPSTTS